MWQSSSRYGSRSPSPRPGDQLQPRLGVARLVLHHRRVVELASGSGAAQELRRHLAREESACSCCMITDRQMSRRRACRSGDPIPPARAGALPTERPRPATPGASRGRRSGGRRRTRLGRRAPARNGLDVHPADLSSGSCSRSSSATKCARRGVRARLRPDGEWAEFFRGGRGYIGTECFATSSFRAATRRRPLGVGRRIQHVRGRPPRGVHAACRRHSLPLRQRAPLRHVRDDLDLGHAFPQELPGNASQCEAAGA